MANQRHVGAVIIEEVRNNMRACAERLYYTVQAPAVYHVYVHRSDYEKLLPIEGKLVAEAARALDEELAAQNRRGRRGLLSKVRRVGGELAGLLGGRPGPPGAAPRYEKGGDWRINLYPDTAAGLKPGDVLVESELAAADGVEPGAGLPTKKMRTVRLDGLTESFEVETVPAAERRADSSATKPRAEEARTGAAARALASISYKDGRGGRREYLMRKEKINVGKGDEPGATPSYWIDLALESDAALSPLHLQLLFDPASRKFFVKDLSAAGTRVNGRLVRSSLGRRGGKIVDLNLTEELPPAARISLADRVILDFKSLLTD